MQTSFLVNGPVFCIRTFTISTWLSHETVQFVTGEEILEHLLLQQLDLLIDYLAFPLH